MVGYYRNVFLALNTVNFSFNTIAKSMIVRHCSLAQACNWTTTIPCICVTSISRCCKPNLVLIASKIASQVLNIITSREAFITLVGPDSGVQNFHLDSQNPYLPESSQSFSTISVLSSDYVVFCQGGGVSRMPQITHKSCDKADHLHNWIT